MMLNRGAWLPDLRHCGGEHAIDLRAPLTLIDKYRTHCASNDPKYPRDSENPGAQSGTLPSAGYAVSRVVALESST